MFKILLTLLFSFYTTISFSHSQLTDILPKNNIVYTKTPSKIELTFRSKVKLVKIDLNKTSGENSKIKICLLYTSPSPRDRQKSRMPSSA